MSNAVKDYLTSTSPEKVNTAFLAYLCNLEETSKVTPEIASSIVKELESQRSRIKLIASENYCSMPTQLSMGNLLTDKYAEGSPKHRFYAGNENVDDIEELAQNEAKKLFNAEYANVQPHCGADANLLAFWAILSTKVENVELARIGETNLYKITDAQWNDLKKKLGSQKLLALDYYSGGHLTHGYRHNISARMFDVYSYAVNKETSLLDYDDIEKKALEVKPLILLAGYSAYPRKINFKRMKEIAGKCGAVLMVDMAHFAGLVAGGVFTGEFSPFPFADVVTTTTHKTLRGPRSGLVLSKKEFQDSLDKGCPLTMGGPLPHVIASKAVAFREASRPEFKQYAKRIVENSAALAAECVAQGLNVVSGGTDNHLLLLNVQTMGLTGRQAESVLHECGITLNRNSLPYDVNGPWYTSGLRIGTPAVTTLGMNTSDMKEIASILKLVLSNTKPAPDEKKPGTMSKAKYVIAESAKDDAKKRTAALLAKYPVYPELDLAFMKKYFVK